MKPQVYNRHQLEREKELYRISIGIGLAIGGFLSLHTIGKPKLRGGMLMAFGVVAFGGGVAVVKGGSSS